MRYPCVIEPGDETNAFGVIFPDCPGCYSGGDTLEEALNNAPEALAGWMEDMIDEGFPINPPSSFDEVAKNPEYKSWIFAMVDVDLDKLSDKTERINICLPSRVLRRLDNLARKNNENRSSYIASLVMSASA